MSLWKIAWRSIQQRSLASSLTAVSMALGVALVVAVLVIHSVVYQSFNRGRGGYTSSSAPPGEPAGAGAQRRLLLGASRLEPISYEYYKKLIQGIAPTAGRIAEGSRSPSHLPRRQLRGSPSSARRPTCSTRSSFSARRIRIRPGPELQGGELHEAVLGATAARKTGMQGRRNFRPTHDVSGGQGARAQALHRRRRAQADRHARRPGDLREHRGLLSSARPRLRGRGRGEKPGSRNRRARTRARRCRFPTS